MKPGKGGQMPNLDLSRMAQDFKGLDPNDPGLWPVLPRAVVILALFALAVTAVWWFDWRDQWDALDRSRAKEVQLRSDWSSKKRQAINLDALKLQLDEINRQFGALLKQLPNRAEMDSLLADINQAGLGRGLQFELFKPGNDVIKDFYAEMPIDVKIFGGYHDLGAFVSDVAKLPRIVTLNDLLIERQPEGTLRLQAKAVTYRYLDEEELAQQKQRLQAAKGAKQGKR